MTTIQMPRKHATPRARVRDLSGRAFDEAAKRARMSMVYLLSDSRRLRLSTSSRLLERVQMIAISAARGTRIKGLPIFSTRKTSVTERG